MNDDVGIGDEAAVQRDTRSVDARAATEEAARTGRFPNGRGEVEDDGNPIEGTVPLDEIDDDDAMRPNEAVPFERDVPGVEVTPPATQHASPVPHQPTRGLDEGVDPEHLDHEGQGVRPEHP